MNMISMEECELLGDSKYRAYTSQVEKALKNFEYTSEWADLISALTRLNKVLSTHMKYSTIPKKVTVGKRLAQCLHPALPSGVHLKAIETYDIIFKCIGRQRLAADLFTYSAGLFPLLGYAAMNVKPTLLSLYETHFLLLGKQIKPALSGLLLGLLPGLEEGSEYYDRTFTLLCRFSEEAGPPFYYTSLWECILSSPEVRQSAITFVLSNFNKKRSMEDQLYFIGNNIELLVEGLCASIEDSSVLVQRGALELLLLGFPLHNSQLTKPDLIKVLTSAVKVVLRRDMSLNRRLYAWLLGTDSSGGAVSLGKGDNTGKSKIERQDSISSVDIKIDYFNQHAKDILVAAFKACIKQHKYVKPMTPSSISTVQANDLRPFRMLISLLDKPEIGIAILEHVFLAMLKYMHYLCQTADKKNVNLGKGRSRSQEDIVGTQDIVKTANLLFGSLEPSYIWDYLARTYNQVTLAGEDAPDITISEFCQLTEFLLDKASLESYIEIQTEHLPSLLHQIIQSTTNKCDKLTDSEACTVLRLCSKLLSHVQPSMLPTDGSLPNSPFSTPIKRRAHTRKSREPKKVFSDSESESFVSVDSDLNCRLGIGSDDTSDLDIDSEENSVRNRVIGKKEQETGETVGSKNETTVVNGEIEINLKEQYSGEKNLENKPVHVIKSISENYTNEKPDSLSKDIMQSCAQSFRDFFYALMSKRVVKCSVKDTSKLITRLYKRTFSYQSSQDSDDDSFHGDSVICNVSGNKEEGIISLGNLSDEIIDAFKNGCQLLTEFSSFPLYCWNSERILKDSFSKGFAPGLPNWLQVLITGSCFIDHFGVQSTAISTMLDLIGLTKSVDASADGKKDTTEGKVSVVIIPPITPNQLAFLENKTTFYEVVCERVWEHLSPAHYKWHQRSVELLYQVHQLTPDPWLCENIIGCTLTSPDKTEKLLGFHRFTVLWHLLRSCHEAPPQRKNLRTFDRSVLVMLESLQSDTHPCRSITHTWLSQALQRGDIIRLLEPMLWILLHPDTARVSIQHVKIERPRRVRMYSESESESESVGDMVEAKIYAISSEGGNVIYHVSNQSNNKAKHKLTHYKTMNGAGNKGKGSGDGPSVTITSMTHKGGSATQKAGQDLHTEMHFEKVDPKDVKLTMNPFTSPNSYDKVYEDYIAPSTSNDHSVLEKARRLDTETCRKEGLFFDEDVDSVSVESVEASVGTENQCALDNPEDIAKSIIEELIDRAMVTSELNEPMRIRLSSIQSRDSLNLCTEDLLNAIDSKVSEIDSQSDIDGTDGHFYGSKKPPIVHPLHTHILLYSQKYDTGRTIYALTCLKALLRSKPRLFTCAVSTTSLGSSSSVQITRLLGLLVRHRRAVFGKNFYSEVTGENVGALKGGMIVETIICVLLYYIRSYYPNFLLASLNEQQLEENKQVQILACEVLGLLLGELINVTRDSGRGFATYISDLLNRCKLQKTMLHCTLASVYNARLRTEELSNVITSKDVPFTEVILNFNRQCMDFNTNDNTFQVKLLRILILIILLENRIRKSRGDGDSLLPPEWETSRVSFQPSLSSVRYVQSSPLIYQTMFLSAIISALKQQHLCSMHQHWLDLLTSVLPYLGRALSHTLVCVVLQLCKNLELLAAYYVHGKNPDNIKDGPSDLPPDHILCLLEGLTTLVHYCLLDSAQQDIWVAQHLPSSNTPASEDSTSTHILSNIINVFRPYGLSRESSPDKEISSTISPVLEARRKLLSNLPRILACLSTLWQAVENSKCHTVWTLGTPKLIRQNMIEFLSPIACNHGVNLLGAVAVVWNDKRQKGLPKTHSVINGVSESQMLLVDLISTIKVMPQDTLIQIVTQVIKQPPPTTHDKNQKRTPLEVNLLQFFFAYVQRQPGRQLAESWPSLLNLLKEGSLLNMPPPGHFLLLSILNDFVQKIPMFDDKTDQKGLQEICQKLLEACSEIAGSQLEQKSLLSRSLVVKPGCQVDIDDTEDALLDSPASDASVNSKGSNRQLQAVGEVSRHYSVHALVLLGELTATLLDMVYKSEEKEKVVPFLMSIMLNVFPYLKNHSVHNLPSLRGCSHLLSSLSSYQYTRKAWKKEAFDLLLEQAFFQMDVVCLSHWRVIIDNLMTNDRTTFKDLLAKVVVAPSASLNLFTSREQEWEQRCQLLKRLTFVILCSDIDQYQRAMPDIQERLSDSLRPPLIPVVQAQVFYCFRVLLLRMSQHNITSLWPSMSTELVQVLLIMEQELAPDPSVKGQFPQPNFVELTYSNNGLSGGGTQGNPGWLKLYLAACKLLDMVLVLPTHLVPQFQLYKWAFVGEMPDDDHKSRRSQEQQLFYPHIIRIAKYMRNRFGDSKLLDGYGQPLLTMRSIKSLKDLHPFFTTLAWGLSSALNHSTEHLNVVQGVSKSKSSKDFKDMSFINSSIEGSGRDFVKVEEAFVLNYVENMVLTDFLDPMQNK